MPMPKSTTIRITWIEESVLRSNTLLAKPTRPTATCETMPITMIGITAMITLRKMRKSRIRISRNVAMPTIASAFAEASCESSACGAGPVKPSRRSVSATSGLASLRSSLTASIDGLS